MVIPSIMVTDINPFL